MCDVHRLTMAYNHTCSLSTYQLFERRVHYQSGHVCQLMFGIYKDIATRDCTTLNVQKMTVRCHKNAILPKNFHLNFSHVYFIFPQTPIFCITRPNEMPYISFRGQTQSRADCMTNLKITFFFEQNCGYSQHGCFYVKYVTFMRLLCTSRPNSPAHKGRGVCL